MAKKTKKAIKKKSVKKKRVWTLARYLIPAARKIWSFSPLRREIRQRTRVSIVKGVETFRCEKCRKLTDKVDVDHKDPIVDPEVGFKDWNTYFERMFCDPSNLWGICQSCHRHKTKQEFAIRKSKKALTK